MSSKCRPVVGSSNMNRLPLRATGWRLALPSLRGLGQETGQLEPLRLAARQRGHRLAQLDVLQADIDDRLQGADHVAVGRKQSPPPR